MFRQKSRRLKAPKLLPNQLELTGGYLAVPNQLLNCAQYGLKPAHLAILLYLLAKPPVTEGGDPWKVNYTHMADQLGIGATYAPKYVTFLREKGFLSFNRNEKGETEWVISLPDFSPKKSEPQRENIHLDNVHVENVAPLITNKDLNKNKETTTAVVLPDYVNQQPVKQALSKLEAKTQAVVLQIMIAAMTKGGIKSPVAYMLGLIKKANDGVLEAIAVEKTGVNPVDKERQRRKDLIAFMQKHREKLAIDFQTKDFVRSETFGNITRVMFRDFEAGKL